MFVMPAHTVEVFRSSILELLEHEAARHEKSSKHRRLKVEQAEDKARCGALRAVLDIVKNAHLVEEKPVEQY